MQALWWLGCLAVTAVYYVTNHFKNKYVNKVVKVVFELYKLANHTCYIQEHFIPYRYLC